jgi:hypothetical protein
MANAVGLSPAWLQANFTDNAGKPLVGGKIWTYNSITGIAVQTYSDAAGEVQNTNPIILDSAGRLQTSIYLLGGLLYYFVLESATGEYITEIDNVAVMQLLAGSNVTLTPSTGIGPQVTISAANGSGGTGVAALPPAFIWSGVQNNLGIVMDGVNWQDFTLTQQVPAVYDPAQIVQINQNLISCSTPGSYLVSFSITLKTESDGMGGQLNWPVGQTVYGIRFSGTDFQPMSVHSRYVDGTTALTGYYNNVTFTDQFTFSVTTPFSGSFSLYAINGTDQYSQRLDPLIQVTITRLGDPYTSLIPPVPTPPMPV